MRKRFRAIGTWLVLAAVLYAQQAPPPAATPAPAPVQTAPPAATVTPTASGRAFLQVENASLTEVVDALARRLKINYIIDPRIKGMVTVKTYGELRAIEPRSMLETILRVNGAALVQVGDLYRIVPMADATRLPMRPQVNPETVPEDEQVSLNLVFLKYATVAELARLLEKFVGEGATMITYDPANLLLLLDNNRNMRRTMELIALFDSDALASQRVKLFEVKNGSPTDIARELETVFRSMSLGGASAVKFMPLERINSIMAVAPNPGIFEEVSKWLQKLDVKVQATAGAIDNYVYRVKYGQADVIAMAIMRLYMGLFGYGYGGYGGYGDYDPSGMMPGGFGGAYERPRYPGGGYPGMGSGGYGYPGMGSLGRRSYSRQGAAATTQQGAGTPSGTTQQGAATATTAVSPSDMTGSYLGGGYDYGLMLPEGMPRVVPNPMDNSLLIQATPQEYEKILKLLKELDVPPRQVLIEAKIYEVTLTGAFSGGVTTYLQRNGSNDLGASAPLNNLATRTAQAAGSSNGLVLTAGMLVGQSRALLGILTANEDNRRTKIISAPVVIATDSIPASINVGQDTPTLASQAITGAQTGGSSLFANTISTRSSGVILSITARINPSGIVTLVVDQEVSTPIAPGAGSAIQSPSFSTRNVKTQVTLQDNDTIAIGGIIRESETSSSAGIPWLHRIPVLGMAFGAKSTTKEKTELVIFLTPRVIYDTNSITEATEEIKGKLKRLTKIIQE